MSIAKKNRFREALGEFLLILKGGHKQRWDTKRRLILNDEWAAQGLRQRRR